MEELARYVNRLYNESRPLAGMEPDRLREAVRELLGTFGPNAYAVRCEPMESTALPDAKRERFLVRFGDGTEIPTYVLTPRGASGRLPAVLALHGHGYGSMEIVGLDPDGSEDERPRSGHKHFALELARLGFKVVAPEVAGFGSRMLAADRATGKRNSCHTLAVRLLMIGKTLTGLRVHESRRMLDWICGLPDVDAGRIGCVGFSGGAILAALTAALDRRVQATVASGYAGTFESCLLAVDHCIDNYVPGLAAAADLPELYRLIAPRPLFVEAGLDDPIFPSAGSREMVRRLEEEYAALGAADRFGHDLFDGGHEVNGIQSFSWLSKVLAGGV